MSSEVKSSRQKPGPRGRPRNEQSRARILVAARELLEQGGPGLVTIEAVAARAKVSRPTIYRWWTDRHAVAMAALLEDGDSGVRSKKCPSSAIRALKMQLRSISEGFSTATGRHVATMLAASDTDSELSKSFRNHFVMARRSEGRKLLEQAVYNGEIRSGLDLEVVLDILFGPIFFRLLMGHQCLSAKFTDRLVDIVMEGLRADKRDSISS